jgi:putative ABC transport system ATP-binding protein
MSSAKRTLEARHLVRSFGAGDTKTTVIHDVSLDLYGGEVALMMGPSGSGKSTLLALLSGLLRPDSGEVIALGKQLGRMSESEQRRFRLQHCGFIFQGFNLFPSLTPREQLEMVLRWGEGTPQREAEPRVEEALKRLGLEHRADLTADQLSGGEKQRVAIARALLKNPNFCFADEPTSSLDWHNGEQVVQLLRAAAHERGATIFIVAHDARIVPFADRVYYLEDGRLSASGAPPAACGLAAPQSRKRPE